MALLELGTTDAGLALLRRVLFTGNNEPDESMKVRIESISRKLHVRHLVHWSALLSQTLADPSARDLASNENVRPLKAAG